ncbi:MAG: DNA repair protein RecO [Thermoguttaceae bacterium]|jgi:DNA repair protein RecO (recombination protein O)
MSIEKTDAIVLRTVDFSESSLVLTLYTRDFGKVRGLAKGARRLKNPFETSLDFLASIKLTFIRKNTDALDLCTESKLARRFRPNERNLRGLYAAYYVAELLDHMTEDYDPDPGLFRLADLTLESLETRGRVGSLVFAFEAGLLDLFGVFPSTRRCVECGEPLPLDRVLNLERPIWFENDMGGVVCRNCLARNRTPGLVPTTIGAFKALEESRRAAEKLILYTASFERNLARQYARAKDESAVAIDEITRNAAVVRDAIERETFAKLEAFDAKSKDALRTLLNRYFARITQRNSRTRGYLGYATRGEPFPRLGDLVKALEDESRRSRSWGIRNAESRERRTTRQAGAQPLVANQSADGVGVPSRTSQ